MNDTNILRLTLKTKWWNMTFIDRIKKEEYREIKPYWISRLCATPLVHFYEFEQPDFRPYTHAEVKLGYARDAPTGLIEIKGIRIGTAVPEWSDNWQGNVFVIEWGNIIELKNLKQNP